MPKPSPIRYRTTNWSDYNAALRKRGSLSVWFDPETVWHADKTGKRGRPETFSDAAIQTCLTLKVLFGLPLRQTVGLVESLIPDGGPDGEYGPSACPAGPSDTENDALGAPLDRLGRRLSAEVRAQHPGKFLMGPPAFDGEILGQGITVIGREFAKPPQRSSNGLLRFHQNVDHFAIALVAVMLFYL